MGYCKIPVLWDNFYEGLNQFHPKNAVISYSNFNIDFGNKRLGKIAELLFIEWIKRTNQYSIIFENLQIIDNKKTIGELDILIREYHSKELFHIELSTKFYLYNPKFNPDDIEAWIGPNKKDSLKNKIEKLKQKQLPLLYNYKTKKYLDKYSINPQKVTQQVYLKALLFVPIGFDKKLEILNPKCIVGNYMCYRKFRELPFVESLFFCPKKQDWLRLPETQLEWFSIDKINIQIDDFIFKNQSFMIWEKFRNTFNRYIITSFEDF